ncbi:MAG: ABC transporter substrate-binding protein, partial [Deinococcota bacterium]
DGDPFDSEDVMFTWEDCILDENVTFWSDQTKFSINGQPVTLEAIDEYTVKWTFPEPFANYMLFNMDMLDFTVAPAHIGKQLHPRYNSDNDYISFTNSQPSDMLPAVTMGPWVPVEYQVDEFLVMRRNPYYWKVDEAGNQLPYIDEVTFEKGDSGLGRTLGTLAGSIDHTNLENPSSYVEATRRLQDEDAHFYIEWGPETLFFSLELNLSANLGVETERDEAMRGLFRDLRFRRALTHAIDREGVAQSIIRGPFLRPFPGGISPGSNFYSRESVAFYDYEPDVSRTLLADLGFEDTDGDDILNWTDGPLAGENLILLLNSNEDQAAGGQIAEALVLLTQDIGIQINHRPITSTTNADNDETGAWEARIGRSEQVWAVPNTRCNDLAPVTKQEPGWHREGSEPRELLAFEQDLIDLVNEFCTEPDSARQTDIMAEYNRIYTENVYTIGTVLGRYGLALAERFNNVPGGTPAFFYQWTWSNVNGDQVWVTPDNQLQQVLPNTIPMYGDQAGN